MAEKEYICLFTRALEAHCRAGRTLQSLSISVLYNHNAQELVTDTMIHRLDTIVSSPQLGVQYLKWNLRSTGDEDEDGMAVDGHNGDWVNEHIFPGINARFLQNEGRREFGTTADVEMD